MNSLAWQALALHQTALSSTAIQALFGQNPNRFSEFSLRVGDILLDYSKQRLTQETLEKLEALAKERGLLEQRDALFKGHVVNVSEQRAALHTALRAPAEGAFASDNETIQSNIHKSLGRLEAFVENISTTAITDVISLGIGGSDLGPSLVCEALDPYQTNDLKLHFVSNVDGKTLSRVLETVNPLTTLCIINSKTFTTPETLQNARSIQQWFQTHLGHSQAMSHLVGVTANPKAAEAFGILPERIFEFWDFVGGRYSVWSAVGLPIALKLGMAQFKAFLEGAHQMDQHFRQAPLLANMPVLMALIGIWNINFWAYPTQAILPYEDGLKQLPAYLQQLEMESNGKRAKAVEGVVSYSTAPVIWGGVGCNGQHAYMQLLHQGTQVIPVDFLIGAKAQPGFEKQQALLVASCLSQSKALMEGTGAASSSDPLSTQKHCEGNRPSSTLFYKTLTPFVLGSLIALYEHKVFVQGVIWGINSFDQWGVELGKKLVKEILPQLEQSTALSTLDSSTLGLMGYFQRNQA